MRGKTLIFTHQADGHWKINNDNIEAKFRLRMDIDIALTAISSEIVNGKREYPKGIKVGSQLRISIQ